MVVQKLDGPEISRFLPCKLEVLNNLRQLFFFSSYKWKRSFHVGPSEKVRYLSLELIVDHPKEDHHEKEFKRYIIGGILDQKKSCKIREAFI